MTLVNLTIHIYLKSQILYLITVSLGGGLELSGSFAVYVSMADIGANHLCMSGHEFMTS